jgi:signal transduction histidine kinase
MEATMRARILRVAVIAIGLTVLVLGVPAAVAIAKIVTADERGELQHAALVTATDASPTYLRGDPIEVPQTEAGLRVGVYDEQGGLVSGSGPDRLDATESQAVSGDPVSTRTVDELVEVVPVTSNERVIAMVRAASPTSAVWTRIGWWWLGLLAGCVAASLAAVAYAAVQARRLAAPISALAASVTRLGEGDFAVETQPSGVPEIDLATRSLVRTAQRLSDALARERAFTDQASHQLRTPLTHLQLELESGLDGDDRAVRRAAASAMSIADQLAGTIEDVLRLARDPEHLQQVDPVPLVEDLADQWRGTLAADGRRLRVEVDSALVVAAAPEAVRQILHVLLDNAYRHGQGQVVIRVRAAFDAAAIDVVDEGVDDGVDDEVGMGVTSLMAAGPTGAMGLAMAQSLAHAQGGRLLVDRSQGTRVTLLLVRAG